MNTVSTLLWSGSTIRGVVRSDIYVGIVADRYGTMLPSGRSPTHEEYVEARRRGKRISFWLQRDAAQRQGHAAVFAAASERADG